MDYQPKDGTQSYYSQAFNIIVERLTSPRAFDAGKYRLSVISNNNNVVLETVEVTGDIQLHEVREELKYKYLLSL